MKTLAYVLPIAALFAAPAYAQMTTSAPPAASAPSQPMTSAEYIAAAGASDMYEIQSSQTVLQTTKDPKVKSFAQMMIKDHTKSTAQLKAAALTAKVKPKPMLTPAQTEMLTQLKAETGTARDQAYIAQQKTAHGQALTIHQSFAQGGKNMALKAVATRVVPVVQHHIEMLQTM